MTGVSEDRIQALDELVEGDHCISVRGVGTHLDTDKYRKGGISARYKGM